MQASVYSKGETTALSGTLIYGKQNSIHALDLSTLKSRVVYEEKNGLPMFRYFTKIDNKRLLVAAEIRGLIEELDLETGVVKTVLSGYKPQYIPEHGKLFFRDELSGKSGFFMVDIEDMEDAAQSARLVREGDYGYGQQVIQVSRDEVVFRQDRGLWLYNIVSDTLNKLSIANCTYPKIMRSATGQLLCFDITAQRYFLADLKGENIEPVPALKDDIAVLYIPAYDTLIFSKIRLQFFPGWGLGEAMDVWAYNFKHKQVNRLKKNLHVGFGDAIWLEN